MVHPQTLGLAQRALEIRAEDVKYPTLFVQLLGRVLIGNPRWLAVRDSGSNRE